MIRRLVATVLIVAGISFWGSSEAYFEHRYFCDVAENSITVSIQTGSKYCFTYISEVHQKLQKVNNDITTATEQIRSGEDVAYRENVLSGLEEEKQDILKLKDQLVAAIDDYEADLFRRVKVILAYYLRDKKDTVGQQLQQADKLLAQFKSMGDRERFIDVQKQIDKLTHTFNLLNAIRDASDFEELISPLKEYIRLDTNKT